MTGPLSIANGHVVLRIRVVPGASREGIAGLLGDRLKLRVAQPPEGGRANAAVLELLADALGVSQSALSIASGNTSRDKSIRIEGIDEPTVRTRLGIS